MHSLKYVTIQQLHYSENVVDQHLSTHRNCIFSRLLIEIVDFRTAVHRDYAAGLTEATVKILIPSNLSYAPKNHLSRT